MNWTIKVAWHEVQAEWRRQARVLSGDPPESLEVVDTAAIAEHRFEWSSLSNAFTGLRPADRAALLAGLDENADGGPLSASEKMRRFRARRRLAALMAANEQTPKSSAHEPRGVANDISS